MTVDTRLPTGSSVLVLAPELPWPARDGGRIALSQLLELLATLGCRLSIAAFGAAGSSRTAPDVPPVIASALEEIVLIDLPRWRAAINSLKGVGTGLPVKVGAYSDPRLLSAVAALLDRRRFDLVIADHLHLATLLPLARERGVPTVLRQHNVESLLADRFLRHRFGGIGRWIGQWTGEARRYRTLESRAIGDAALTLAISETDADAMRRIAQKGQVGTLSPYVGISPEQSLSPQNPHVLFLGSLDWAPNVEGAVFLAREIMPRVRASRPGARCCVVGKRPDRSLRRLLDAADVELYGDVPDAAAFLVPNATLVVPLFVGSGVRIKILEAMAHRVPVISSAIGVEGLPCRNREHVLLAEHAEDFAAAVNSIWMDAGLAEALVSASAAMIARNFSREVSLAQLSRHLEVVLDTRT